MRFVAARPPLSSGTPPPHLLPLLYPIGRSSFHLTALSLTVHHSPPRPDCTSTPTLTYFSYSLFVFPSFPCPFHTKLSIDNSAALPLSTNDHHLSITIIDVYIRFPFCCLFINLFFHFCHHDSFCSLYAYIVLSFVFVFAPFLVFLLVALWNIMMRLGVYDSFFYSA